MPQEFHVVRCFSCEAFQTQQVKKVNKFVCKLCGSKQSVRKEYGRGSGKDCRIHVQKLNNLRGEIEEKEEEMLGCKFQDDSDLNFELYGQDYNVSEQYEGDEQFVDVHQYNDFQNESEFNEEISTTVNVSASNINNHHKKEGKMSKWTSYLSNETGDEEEESTEVHEHFKQEKGWENYEGSSDMFENNGRKSMLATKNTKKVQRGESHPYQRSTARISKSTYNVNYTESDKELFLRKYNESHTNVPVNTSKQRKTDFAQDYITCPSITVSEKKTQFISLKENIQFKKETSRSVRTNSEADLSTNKNGTCITAKNNAEYKEKLTLSDSSVLLESKPLSSHGIKNSFKSKFMAKVKGTQSIYNKFADAHELEDIL